MTPIGKDRLQTEAARLAKQFDVRGVVIVVLHQNSCEYATSWPGNEAPVHIDQVLAQVGHGIRDGMDRDNN